MWCKNSAVPSDISREKTTKTRRRTTKKSFDAMVEAEATFKTDLEKLLKHEGHMPEDKFLVMSRKGKRLGVAFASTPRGEGGGRSLKFTK